MQYFPSRPWPTLLLLPTVLLLPSLVLVLASSLTDKAALAAEPDYTLYGIYQQSAPRAATVEPVATRLPLTLRAGDRIALVGNNLLDRERYFGYLETLLQQQHAELEVTVRNLAWSADTPDLQPRPANFADWDQHLTHERADVVIAAYGFNESFAGAAGLEAFRESLADYLGILKSKAFNGEHAPQVVLLSPIANENVERVPAADLNNSNLALYTQAMREVAAEQYVGFVDLFTPTAQAMQRDDTDLTINGSDLNDDGYRLFADLLMQGLFQRSPPDVSEPLRAAVLDKSRQYFRRYRPANTFYYTGDRNKSYGYLDFLPAMRNFDVMVANRDRRIWTLARGESVPQQVDDSNVPRLPRTKQNRDANRWMSAADELKSFTIDPRFEVTLFAGEEEFSELGAPIQMRWDAQGRLWVSCSTTYPHVYPGNEPDDKLIILEDTDGDGRADRSSVFADDLHIPLSFEFGDGGVYVSEMPHLTFIKDTDGDGKADSRRIVYSSFGTEDSHHSLHDFAWTPTGDLIFREGIFHHTQVETPYGPVRQRNSGWFRYRPRSERLESFGTYHSTNPWGVTFDDWGQHQASHPIYAAAFHSLDPPYPQQHPKPAGLQAYSGTCGQEFVDFATFPDELQGHFIKARYKPTNRIEIHEWNEQPFGYEEKYVGDLIFSSNLSFIPVDIRYGPRGAMYVCDWYNPIKGHAQYSLRDDRRDRHSGRIWRIKAKGRPLQEPPQIAGASIAALLEIHKRPEYRYRYWAKRELRERDPAEVKRELDTWAAQLDSNDSRYRHHQVEALWLYQNIGHVNGPLLREVMRCDNQRARAAATQLLRDWHANIPDAIELLTAAANDPNGIVRMEAAIAATYIGTKGALDAALQVYQHPLGGHLAYAANTALGSHTLRRHWEDNPDYDIASLLRRAAKSSQLREPPPTAGQAQFDSQQNLQTIEINCLAERMRFSVDTMTATAGQPLKIVFKNEDATDHNLVFVKPDALAEVGMAANEMARDPKNANSDFIPAEKKKLILHASPLIGPTRKKRIHVMRFNAPTEPGLYPFVCTFPGHWVIMNGVLAVGESESAAKELLASRVPKVLNQWKLGDFEEFSVRTDEQTVMRGMQAFVKAQCHQCHQVAGHGINIGPELKDIGKRFQGKKLLQQILEPSAEVNEKFKNTQLLLDTGNTVVGVITRETDEAYFVTTNLLAPKAVTRVPKRDVDELVPAKLSPMPTGLVDMLTKQEITDLVSSLQAGGYELPEHLEHRHHHGKGHGE